MTLISLLLVWPLLKMPKVTGFFRQDLWFEQWLILLSNTPFFKTQPGLKLFTALILPLAVLALICLLLFMFVSPLALVLLNVPVLLYVLRRGDFNRNLREYIAAWRRGDSVACVQILLRMDAELPAEILLQETDSWPQLHLQALRIFSYCGFERTFSVFFWFVVLGAPGALLYRLSALYLSAVEPDDEDRYWALKWLWILEWPAVRVLGLSWAMVGNFVGCFTLWRECFFCARKSSSTILLMSAEGALGILDVNDDEYDVGNNVGNNVGNSTAQQPESASESRLEVNSQCIHRDCTGRELTALNALMSRTLLLWICLVALVSIFM